MLSVDEWLAPSPKAELQVSRIVAPASTPLRKHIADSPEVAWLCRWMGSEMAAFSALTSSLVAAGVSRPAMSLMARVSQPMASNSLAMATK
jgi:hypothetical protein